MMLNGEEWISTAEAADLLGVPTQQIRRLIHRLKLRHLQMSPQGQYWIHKEQFTEYRRQLTE